MTRDDSRSFPDPANADELLRHAAWLRALARTLVGEADADDVVQETWVAAVAHRPSAVHSLRAWLGAVARNVVRQRARADTRRREREAATANARAPDAPSTEEVVARAARMRELVERVLALDEPYRSTILLRFFEGVKPQEIARRVGASEEAVRQRLKRGLDRLREQLDAEHGGERERWIAGLAPLVALPSSTALLAKGVAMSASTKLVATAATVIVAIGIAVLLQRRESASPTHSAGAFPPPSARDAVAAASADRSAGHVEPAREAEGADRSSTSAPTERVDDAPVHFVYGAVVDASGAAIDDVTMQLFAIDSTDPKAPTSASPWSTSASHGAWSAGGLAPGQWKIRAFHQGLPECDREFTIESAIEGRRQDVVFRTPISIPVRFLAPDGRRLADVATSDSDRWLLREISVLGLSGEPPARFDAGFDAVFGRSGNGNWFARRGTPFSNYEPNERVAMPEGADGVLISYGEAPSFVAATLSHRTLASVRIVDPAQRIDFVVDPEWLRSAYARIRTQFVDVVTKRPIEGVRVALDYGHMLIPEAGRSDREGRITLARLMPGPLGLQFSSADHQSLALAVDAEAGSDVDLGTIELSLPITLHGRVTRSDGQKVEGTVRYFALDHWSRGRPLSCDFDFGIDANGKVELTGMGRGRYLVRAGARDCAETMAVVDTRRDSSATLELELIPGTPVDIQWARPLPLQPPVFEIDSEDGELLQSARGIGAQRMRPGRYRLLALRGDARIFDLPFEVGTEPVTVRMPRIDDPSGLTFSENGATPGTTISAAVAPKILGDPIGIVCYGRVVGGGRRGLVEGSASVCDDRNAWQWGLLHDGCFAVAGLRPGRVQRQFFGDARLPFADWIAIAASPVQQRRDFQVAPGFQIAIAVVDAESGAPIDQIPADACTSFLIPRFTVIATKEPPSPEVSAVESDWNFSTYFGAGRFQWLDGNDVRKGGFLDVSGDVPLFVSLVSGGRVLHTQQLDARVERLTLPVDWNKVRADLAGIRFRLVDAATGEALAASRIDVVATTMGSTGGSGKLLPFDEERAYVRTGLPPGECKLDLTVPGKEALEFEISLPPGRVTDLGTISVGAPRIAKGRIVDAEGRPVRTNFRVLDVDPSQGAPLIRRSEQYGESGDDGAFSTACGSGVSWISIFDERFAATCLEVDPAHEPCDALRIVLVPGTPVTIRVLPEDVSRERITIVDGEGHLVVARTLTMGPYRLKLRPGKYSAVASLLGDELAREDFEVAEIPVEVALQR